MAVAEHKANFFWSIKRNLDWFSGARWEERLEASMILRFEALRKHLACYDVRTFAGRLPSGHRPQQHEEHTF